VLEKKLAKEGFTSGHEPDSQELSTLGGWISTNASGMKRHRYGGIEDIVEQITLVTPNGQLETLDAFPRQSVGVQVKPALFGSEGNFGLITKAVIRLRELPEATVFQSVVFPNFERGVEFLKALSGTSFLPASIRLVDNNQFRFGHALKAAEHSQTAKVKSKLQRAFLQSVKGIDLSQMAAATLVMEGSRSEVAAQEKLIGELAGKYQGFFGGAGNGKRGYNLTFAIAYIRDFLTKLSVMGETVETTAPWDKIHDICDAVKREAKQIHKDYQIPGKPFVSYRITQLYVTGVCIYFTYGVCTKGLDGAHIAADADHRLRGAIVKAGGAISNHHGVGKFRAALLEQKLTAPSGELIRSMKGVLDPSNVFGAGNGVFATKQ
jgi:alkyldihydroxyacetonephosphate synthase